MKQPALQTLILMIELKQWIEEIREMSSRRHFTPEEITRVMLKAEVAQAGIDGLIALRISALLRNLSAGRKFNISNP